MRWLLLLLIAIITFVIVLLVKNPDIVKQFWLWVVGFSGIIIHIFQVVRDFIKKMYSKAAEIARKEKIQLTEKID